MPLCGEESIRGQDRDGVTNARDDSYFGPSEEAEDANYDFHVASWSHSRARLAVGDSHLGRPSTWPLRTVTLIIGSLRS